MDLTKMFLNTYTSCTDLNIKSNTVSAGSKSSYQSFESYLNKAESSSSASYSNKVNSKDDASKLSDNKDVSSKNTDKANKSESGNDAAKDTENSTEKIKSDNSDNKEADTTENTKVKETESTEAGETVNTAESNDADKTEEENLKDIDKDIVNTISEKTGLSIEEINAVLQSLNMQAAELSDSNNLISFMMELTGVENAIDLISVDGVKEIMTEIKQVFAETDEFTAFADEISAQALNVQEDNAEGKNIEIKNTDANTEEPLLQGDTTVTAEESTFAEFVIDSEELRNSKLEENENELAIQQDETPDILQSDKVVAVAEEASFSGQNMAEDSSSSFMFENEGMNDINASGVVMDNITKAFSEAMLKTDAARNADPVEIVQQIIDKVKVGINKDVTELKLSLKPEELGDVTVKIASHNGIVTAQITAESQMVKEIIEAGFNQLKQALADAGVEVSQLEVNVGSGDENDDFENNMTSGEKSSSRINQIIAEEENDEINYVKENEVVGASVSYTA